ncbi:hypothetical protein SEA_HANNACONDA_15 [Mycobacterium phage Hannaconda]|uniref:Uncharacterized protein n=2 Tax=Omegavirus courthouse TaxID=1089119 RepID=G8I575_9CAUD|nr:zinc-finger protease [Mycobacterium phage Courthouse]YP_009213235.1 zinc-finger protease [Mycobacterium phage MiaZeal]ASD50659.1 hypothetical protein PORCELAIN_18 [Mycobacterium phage Porcelain]ATS92861.1 hypothetical protein SEA_SUPERPHIKIMAN_18 [Mycobacterium phage Superphikiman]QGJ93658.1 hypothetical protein SEA_HANNACONDA_15 [Mycobacterium phage Hannaconda]QPO16622.1 hypothetical protein SEA_KASHFLOW_12 [Mycobacterium phage KashFlow]AER47869.1 hypothetical protein COURTHOUSE_18 [Mycob
MLCGIFAFLTAPALTDPWVIKTVFSRERPTVMDEIAEAINDVAQAYSEVRGIEVRAEAIDPHVYGYAMGGKLIMFNKTYTSNPERFRKLVENDITLGFHPELGRCSHAELLAYHEAAHVIDQKRHLKPRVAFAEKYGRGEILRGTLSGYSFTTDGRLAHGEALAEAFAATLCGSANDTERDIFAFFN